MKNLCFSSLLKASGQVFGFFLSLLIVTVSLTGFGQNPTNYWALAGQLPGFDEVVDVAFHPNGNVIELSQYEQIPAMSSDRDIRLRSRFATEGIQDWEILVGGELDETAEALAVSPGGNLLVAGSFQGMVDFDPSVFNTDLEAEGTRDAFVAEYDENGVFVNAVRFGYDLGICELYDITVDGSGNVLVAGAFAGTMDADPGPGEFFFSTKSVNGFYIKLSPDLEFIEAHYFFSVSSECVAIDVDEAGNVYVAGTYINQINSDGGEVDLCCEAKHGFVAKYASDGVFQFLTDLGDTGIEEEVFDLKIIGPDKFAVASSRKSSVPDIGDMPPVGGGDAIMFGSEDWSFVVSSFSGGGTFQWDYAGGGTFIDRALALGVDESGNIYAAGTSLLGGIFHQDSGTLIGQEGQEDIILVRLNQAGVVQWAGSIGGVNSDRVKCMAVDNFGRMLLGAVFYEPMDVLFGPEAYVLNLFPDFAGDGLSAMYCLSGLCLSNPGCTDILACNYNPEATEDDGSCIPSGCTDPAACNYDPAAGCDYYCDYSYCSGCTDEQATNYDPYASVDDGSCEYDGIILYAENDQYLCTGETYVFTIAGFESGDFNDTYDFYFSDGSPSLSFTHEEMLNNPTLIHEFEFNSCGAVSSEGTPNANSISLFVYSYLDGLTSTYVLDSLYVSGPGPDASVTAQSEPFNSGLCADLPFTYTLEYSDYWQVDENGCSPTGTVLFDQNAPDFELISIEQDANPYFISGTFGPAGNYTLNAELEVAGCLVDIQELAVNVGSIPEGTVEVNTFAGGNVLSNVAVELYALNSGEGIFSSETTNSDGSGFAGFTGVASGQYLCKAIPDPGLFNQQNMLGTFTNETYNWSQANVIIVGCESVYNDTIHMIQLPEPGDFQGAALGTVYYRGQGLPLEGGSEGMLSDEPIPGVPVIIELDADPAPSNENFFPFALQVTGVSGQYGFENLPEGEYRLVVDLPGLPMADTYHFEIANPEWERDSLDFFIDYADAIYTTDTLVSMVEIGDGSTFWIYPNPFSDFVILQSDKNDINAWVEVFDITGRQVQSPVWWAASDRLRVELKGISAGLYVVEIRTGESVLRMKIQKL